MNLSPFWHWWVVVITVGTMAGCLWLLFANSRGTPGDSTDHVWDDDLREYNNPLPLWWRNLFLITIIFSAGYLLVYPGLGNFAGQFGWTQRSELRDNFAKLEAERDAMYARLKDKDLMALSKEPSALALGHAVFMNNCAGCHGADAKGAIGFPNLTDDDWLYGGEPDTIVQTITNGRRGVMPPFKSALNDDQLNALLDFVPYWSDPKLDAAKRERGTQQFAQTCAPCHGGDGKGMQVLGSANLTDDIWLYGGSRERVRETILNGRSGAMPAWQNTLSPDEIRVVAAYVYNLSHSGQL